MRVIMTVAICVWLAACGPGAVETTTSAETTSTAVAEALPQQVGDCTTTTVEEVGPRLEGVPDSGSAILYANTLAQVSYDAVPGIDHSQVGDEVRLCLTSLPENCPPGDERGRVYEATNARTGESWSAMDSQHMCGGA
jgi:hypothetical protein